MVTIREYYDLFRRYAPQKSDKDFADQALMVGYSQQDVDSVVQLKTAAPTPAYTPNTTSQNSISVNRIQQQPLSSVLNKPTTNPSISTPPSIIPPRTVERPLPPLVVRPSSYVARNQIGVSSPGVPSGLKSFPYSPQTVASINKTPVNSFSTQSVPEQIKTQTQPIQVAASNPNPVQYTNTVWPVAKPVTATPNFSPTTSIPNLPGAIPVSENLPNGPVSFANQPLQSPIQPASSVGSPIRQAMTPGGFNSNPGVNIYRTDNTPPAALNPVLRSDFTAGSSVNMLNRTKIETPKVAVPVMTMANQAPTDAARIITRAPLPEHPVAFNGSSGSKSSFLKIILIILLFIALAIGGIAAYLWYSGGLKKNINNILSDAAPYESANALNGILQKLSAQKDIPYVAQLSINVQDKGNGASFTPSAYQKNSAFARDTKKVEDLNKVRDLLVKNFTTKKKYPRTLKEISFATLDPNGKAYAYSTNPALTTYKIVVDFETDEMLANVKDSLPRLAASSSKVTFTQADVGEILVLGEPFDDTWNDWLAFPSKIDALSKRFNINTNVSGNLSQSDSVLGDSSLSAKGPLSYNNLQKSIDLQLVNHSGAATVKSNYLDKWVVLDGEHAPVNLFGLIKEITQSSIGQGIWSVKEPVHEQVVLSNQLSVDSFRYDLTLKSITLDTYLSVLKDRLVKGSLIDVASADKIAFVASHKDTRALGNYLASITSAHVWIDQKGEPLKLEILLGNISGRTSGQKLNVDLLVEFGQDGSGHVFNLPNELSATSENSKVVHLDTLFKDHSFTDQFSGISTTIASSTKIGSSTVNINPKPKYKARRPNILDLFLPLRDIQDSIDRLKQSEGSGRPSTGSTSSQASSTPGNVGLMPPGGIQNQNSVSGTPLVNTVKTTSSVPQVPKKEEPASKPLPNRLF